MLGPILAPTPDLEPDDLPAEPPIDLQLEAEAEAEAEAKPLEPAATGFAGDEPALPVEPGEPRQVDPGFVIVEPDEVKTKAQPHTGRKEVWTFTAVVLVAGCSDLLAEASPADRWLRVGALLAEWGVLRGERRLLILGDGAAWIRAWFVGLELSGKAMVLCWWHLRKRCYESLSLAGGPKERRKGLENAVLNQHWRGQVDAAIGLLGEALGWTRNPAAVATLIGYLEKRREYLPDYQQRHRAGLWIASTRVEKFNDWAVSDRCKHHGMSWTPQGVLALASLEATRRNGELESWRGTGELPESMVPKPLPRAA